MYQCSSPSTNIHTKTNLSQIPYSKAITAFWLLHFILQPPTLNIPFHVSPMSIVIPPTHTYFDTKFILWFVYCCVWESTTARMIPFSPDRRQILHGVPRYCILLCLLLLWWQWHCFNTGAGYGMSWTSPKVWLIVVFCALIVNTRHPTMHNKRCTFGDGWLIIIIVILLLLVVAVVLLFVSVLFVIVR